MTGLRSRVLDTHATLEQNPSILHRHQGERSSPRYTPTHLESPVSAIISQIPVLDEPRPATALRDTLFAEFAPLVRRLVRRYGTSDEARQEMVGEIYCRFCRLVEAYDPERGVPLRPYLVHQLTASVHTYARQCWTHSRRITPLEDTGGVEATPPAADPTAEWDRQMWLQQLYAALPRAFRQISRRQRQIILWRYFDGFSYEEIADRLNIRPASVRSLLSHGLKNLRCWMIQNHFRWD